MNYIKYTTFNRFFVYSGVCLESNVYTQSYNNYRFQRQPYIHNIDNENYIFIILFGK